MIERQMINTILNKVCAFTGSTCKVILNDKELTKAEIVEWDACYGDAVRLTLDDGKVLKVNENNVMSLIFKVC